MLGFIGKIIGGRKSEKDIKSITPLVGEINAFFEAFQSISNDELRKKTDEFRTRVKDYLQELDTEIHAKEAEAEDPELDDIFKKDAIYEEVDKIKEKRDEKLEEVLMEILPEAFAVMKETARRFKENEELVATATELDRQLAVDKPHINIIAGKDGAADQVVYKNTWEAAGNMITWNMLHYDVQLIGGIVLHQGKVAEMATGEGKTLVSTLPSYLNGLTGQGVHIVTVNDYLARRDQEWNSPLLEFLGLTTDCIDKHQPHSAERRQAYLADVVYGTNNEFGFDYLRDNMVHSPEEMVQRKHHFAMVDEVDSVLIDDARTPLIISGPVPKGEEQEFVALKPRVQRLVDAQKKVVLENLQQAKKMIAEGQSDPKSGGLHLFRAYKGLPKNHALIKYLSEPGNKVLMQKAQNHYLADQEREMPTVIDELFFVIDEKNNTVDLTDKGIQMITAAGEDPSFFIMPDIGSEIADVENSDLSAEDKLTKKDELLQDFSVKSERIHSMQQLLKAYSLFEKDDEYVVMDGKVKIVDEQTGRILEGRRYSDGLHQAIEAKEGVKVEAATQTFATITLQNYFRMYHKLAGMTGTASTEAGELWEIYKLDVVEIPTNLPVVREDNEDFVYKTVREKYRAVIESIKELRAQNRPILVGTTSVEVSELLSKMLRFEKIPHNVLNAKQHQREAQVVAEAGLPGNVTIATNMAGRGTDIKLGEGVKEAGGLAILGTARHDSRRVDLQLRGRSGRQGDPGSSQFYVSLEDDLMRMFGSERIAGLMDRMGYKEGEVIQHRMISRSIERAQRKVEENNFGIRKRLLDYDDVMNKQRTVIYDRRRHALFGERLALDIDNAFYDVAASLITAHKNNEDHEGLKLEAIRYLGLDTSITAEELEDTDENTLADKLYHEAKSNYERKAEEIARQTLPVIKRIKEDQGDRVVNISVPFTDGIKGLNVLANLESIIQSEGKALINALEKNATLAFIDESWKEHLRAMDDLKQSVQSAVYEQKDPLVIYKVEAFSVFRQMVEQTNLEIISFLCKASIPVAENEPQRIREGHERKTDMSKMRMKKEQYAGAPAGGDGYEEEEYAENAEPVKQEPVRVGPKVGRNDPCPCGSGKKYKHCHGKNA